MHDDYLAGMNRFLTNMTIVLLAGLAGSTAMPLAAQSFSARDEQNEARRRLLDGDVMPFRLIRRGVEQKMGEDFTYVGVAPSPREGVYRMQFLRKDGVVTWVDVDGKSGQIIARTK